MYDLVWPKMSHKLCIFRDIDRIKVPYFTAVFVGASCHIACHIDIL